MMRNRFFYTFVSIICYVSLFSIFLYQYKVLAEDIVENIEYIEDQEKEYEEDLDSYEDNIEDLGFTDLDPEETQTDDQEEEDQEEDLKDIYKPIKSVKSSSSGSRAMVNTYSDDNSWHFNDQYYWSNSLISYEYQGTTRSGRVWIFNKDNCPPYSNIVEFVNNAYNGSLYLADFPSINSYVVGGTRNDFMSDDTLDLVLLQVTDYIDFNGYPSSNTFWDDPYATPTVTPVPTGSPDPTPSSNESVNVMVIFGIGLLAGVIVGHFMTGFIK